MLRRALSSTRAVPAQYNAKVVENGKFENWSRNGIFRDFPSNAKKFTMLFPPPNITGTLHLGHALTVSLQDALARYHRMCGYNVQWIPGLDHAGIATQAVIEKRLRLRDGAKPTRDELLTELQLWKDSSSMSIIKQLQRLGGSWNFDRFFFTLDDNHSETVQQCFIRLFEEGLIYRQSKIVNWCPHLKTVLSDIEVNHIDLNGETSIKLPGRKKAVVFGVIHEIIYEICDYAGICTGETVSVHTTRPETILGDVALAINSTDHRYLHLIADSKSARNPVSGKVIPFIVDNELVNTELGSGVVKVSPAHDENDYECAMRNGLDVVDTFDELGRVNFQQLNEFHMLDRFEARDAIIQNLRASGHYVGKKNHVMRLSICSRSEDVIEPRLIPQWYLRTEKMAEALLEKSSEADLKIFPREFRNQWTSWLRNSRDWCLSRQLVWGHRIPMFAVIRKSDKEIVKWFAAPSKEIASEKYQLSDLVHDDYMLTQEADVLDTWFSSALIPLTVTEWGKSVGEYPMDFIESGTDILFFWLARMAMLSLYFTGEIPFRAIGLHGMVRDKYGRKMSKSSGNAIDFLEIMDGSETSPGIGADALRFYLAEVSNQTRGINVDPNRIATSRYTANKIWNASEYCHSKFSEFSDVSFEDAQNFNPTCAVSRSILSRLNTLIKRSHKSYKSFEISDVAQSIAKFVSDDFCGTFIEYSKHRLRTGPTNDRIEVLNTLKVVLDIILHITHPLMPFITDEIWGRLNCESTEASRSSLVQSEYPKLNLLAHTDHPPAESLIDDCLTIVSSYRNTIHSFSLSRKPRFVLVIRGNEKRLRDLSAFEEKSNFIAALAGAAVEISVEIPDRTITAELDASTSIHIPYDKNVDLTKSRQQLESEFEKVASVVDRISREVSNPEFEKKARPEIAAKRRQTLKEYQAKFEFLRRILER
eukprot:Partr_v1_DN28974_c0_g1_i7_m25474 putative Valyl-trna synthetase